MRQMWTTREAYDTRQRYVETRAVRLAAARKMGTHTALEWNILSSMIGCCVKCGAADAVLAKDHIISLHAGGCDCIGNLQPLCKPCNSADPQEDLRADYVPDWSSRLADIMGSIFR
jgi:5-methylcytosine-specific restriction endonuclease McrA